MKTTVKLKPLGDRIVATAVEPETKTASGILLPDKTAKDKQGDLADVVAVGPGVEEVKVGDQIIYVKYSAESFKQDGVEYLMFHEEDALAVVTQ